MADGEEIKTASRTSWAAIYGECSPGNNVLGSDFSAFVFMHHNMHNFTVHQIGSCPFVSHSEMANKYDFLIHNRTHSDSPNSSPDINTTGHKQSNAEPKL